MASCCCRLAIAPRTAVAAASAEPAKYVVIATDVFGHILPNVRLLADAFADRGYYCVVPDIVAGDPLPLTIMDLVASKPAGIAGGIAKAARLAFAAPPMIGWFARHGDASAAPALDAVVQALRSEGGSLPSLPTARAVAAVGYCFGGRYAVLAAADVSKSSAARRGDSAPAWATRTAPLVDAVAVAHPSRLTLPADLTAVRVPALLCLAEKEMPVGVPASRIAELEAWRAAGTLDARFEFIDYKGVSHGFAVRGNEDEETVLQARDKALRDMCDFFDRFATDLHHLGTMAQPVADTAGTPTASTLEPTSAPSDGDDDVPECCRTGYFWAGREPQGTVEQVGGVAAYVARPRTPTAPPSGGGAQTRHVVIVTDVFGHTLPNVRLLADAFADRGFVCTVPDILGGDAIKVELADLAASKPAGLFGAVSKAARMAMALPPMLGWFSRHDSPSIMPVLEAVVRELRGGDSGGADSSKVAVVGYCFGGLYAALAAGDVTKTAAAAKARGNTTAAWATRTEPLADAFAAAHPSRLTLPTDLAAVRVPTLLSLAEKELSVGVPASRISELEEWRAAGTLDARFEFVEYKGVSHGFAVRGDEHDEVVLRARDKVLRDMCDFFDRVMP
ncbi:hypothetical protein HK405_009595 [Cladochytrium tenue]|nr:hypothetical protein HK405_009595 [Cladochytrium tenue]